MTDELELQSHVDPIGMYLFGDERKLPGAGQAEWLYFGVLFVSHTNARLLHETLIEIRKAVGYDGYIHLSGIKNSKGETFETAKRWLDFAIEAMRHPAGLFRMNVLGVRLDRLDRSAFGVEPAEKRIPHARVYTRFFRTVVQSGRRLWWYGVPVRFLATYHDSEGNLQNDPWFDGNLAKKLTSDGLSSFESRYVQLIRSDHRLAEEGSKVSRAAQVLQFVDLILGTTTNILHPGGLRTASAKFKLTEQVFSLVESAWSTSNHVERSQLGFAYSHFPRSQRVLVNDDSLFAPGDFYRLSPLDFAEHRSGQGTLFEE